MGGGRKLCLWFLANCEVQLCSALAAISILGVVVVCPVMLDPAIDTLVSSFEEGKCQTIYSQSLRGLSNCSWTSCREGCTAEIYTCHHILVVYVRESHFIPRVISRGDTGKSSLLNNATPSSSAAGGSDDGWNVPLFNFSYTYARDLNLSFVSESLLEVMEAEGYSEDSYGVGSLIPNPQGCIYPSENTLCSDFVGHFGNVTKRRFPCFISNSNSTIVVTEVDKMGAVRNILYCFIPLVIAMGVFTYLFYQVGLIGNGKKRKLKRREGEDGDPEEGAMVPGSPSKSMISGTGTAGRVNMDKNGQIINGPTPGIKKTLRKKFLPRRENSSKRKRKAKIFSKKNARQGTLSVRTPGTSISGRTPSLSVASDDGLGQAFSLQRLNQSDHHRQSLQLLYTSIGSRSNTIPNEALKYVDPNGEVRYRPAYTLHDSSSERNGRQSE